MATQIQKPLPGKHKHLPWAGTTGEDESEEDNIDENGTDYKGVKKSHDDDDDHEDEPEDRKLFNELMSKEDRTRKSFFDIVNENPILSKGVEDSPFLFEMVKSIGLSLHNLENQAGYCLESINTRHTDFAKSMDGAFGVIGERLGIIDATAESVDMQKSMGIDADVGVLQKSGFSDSQISRQQIKNALEKSVFAGEISPVTLIKYESTGLIDDSILKSLNF